MVPIFIDWVTMRQDWPEGGLPVLNGGHVVRIDPDGAVEWRVDQRLELEGSYDSQVAIRCDGHRVEFSGNISRYNRRDNLFGYQWRETIDRINNLLNLYSIPPFTRGKLFRFADTGWTWTGARASRIDVTMNYATFSSESAQAVMSSLAGHHIGRQKGILRPDGATIEYGAGSKYVYGKIYVKAVEFERHANRKSGSHVDSEVVDFCRNYGVLREEFGLKSRFLTQRGLAYLGAINQEELNNVFLELSQFRRFENVE